MNGASMLPILWMTPGCIALNAVNSGKGSGVKMIQSRRHSFIKSWVNVGVGYFVALMSQLAVFPLFNIHVPLRSNLGIGLWFTAISIGRSYVIRRWFTKRTEGLKHQSGDK